MTTNANLEVYESGRVAWNGDYVGVAAVPGRTFVAWTDNRDVRTGVDSRNPDDADGNDVHLPCDWVPNDEGIRSYESPDSLSACFSEGGLDQNVYGASLPAQVSRLTVRAQPVRVRAGRPAHLTIAVSAAHERRTTPIRGALVRLARSRARTDRRGIARIRTTLRRTGTYSLRVSRRGFAPVRLTIRAVSRRRDGG